VDFQISDELVLNFLLSEKVTIWSGFSRHETSGACIVEYEDGNALAI
jgi:hypothetical protein